MAEFGGIEVAKAKGPSGAVATREMADVARAIQGYLARNRRQGEMEFGGIPLPRNPAWSINTFGPLDPLIAEGLDPARNDTHQPEPRLYQYPVAWNVQIGYERHVNWEILRRSSESPLFRACIELRKTELISQEWQIRVSPRVSAKIAIQEGKTRDEVATELRSKYHDEINRLSDWWAFPDRKNGQNFSEWLSLAMDEQLTHDALAVYPHCTYGGELLGLWVIDGSTIMPLLDETGGRPVAPYPAYQQILYGFPRGEFTAQTIADADGNKVVPGGLTAGQLIYKRRTPRRHTPYGYAPTEQALLDGVLQMRRNGWMLSEYTEGVFPAQFFTTSEQFDWTPTQLMDYERDFNLSNAGKTAERMKARLLPPGVEPVQLAHPGERYSPEYDLFLIKLVAMHFGITASELGFNDSGGLGSDGYHEGQEDINYRRARMPDLRWWADLLTELSQRYLGMPGELEFTFLGLDADDEAVQDELDNNRLASGRITLNESRARIGLGPYGFSEADMPMLQTARGVVFIEGASEIAIPGVMIEPASEGGPIGNDLNGDTLPNGAKTPAAASGKPKLPSARSKPVQSVSNAQKELEELRAFKNWQLRPNRKRQFVAKDMTPEFAAEHRLPLDQIDFADV